MSEADFRRRLWLSSVPLVRLDENRLPTGIGTGALIGYGGKRILLTVEHVTGDQKRWAVQVKYDPTSGRTLVRTFGPMNFLMQASLGGKAEDVDFSYVEVPADLIAFRQEIVAPANTVKSETPITVHSVSLTDLPSMDDTFGFCGMVKPSLEDHHGNTYLYCEPRIYSGLTYLRSEGGYHYFRLPFPHPGHEEFRGCSGAPVLGESGAFVGLLCGGCIKTNEVWAISTTTYKTAIDILVGNFN